MRTLDCDPAGLVKCLNSQNAPKCLRRVLKVIWGLWAKSPKRVSRTVQNLFRTGRNSLKQGFAPCKRLFWDSRSRGPKTPFAPSLKHFWVFWLFRHLTLVPNQQRRKLQAETVSWPGPSAEMCQGFCCMEDSAKDFPGGFL